MNAKRQIVRLLQSTGLLSAEPDLSVLQSRNEGPILALSRLGLVQELQAIRSVSEKLGIAYLDLAKPEIARKCDLGKFSSRVDSALCWKSKIAPLWESETHVTVAFSNPLDFDACRAVEFACSKKVEIVIAEESKITRLLSAHLDQSKIEFDLLGEEVAQTVEVVGGVQDELDIEPDPNSAATPPIVRLVNKVLYDAITAQASDIHVEPLPSGVDVRLRVDGVMQHVLSIPKRLQPYVISRFKILSGLDISERRRPQDGRLRVRLEGSNVDMRVSVVPAAYGEKVVLRLLRSSLNDLAFSALGFPPSIESGILSRLGNKGRMLLVSGPTGSGKTTTLYAAINYLKDGTTNIETVEDPVEFKIEGINQIQVNEAANVTFATALRSILRQDPDVIMVGEIRDSVTATIALQAAQTGHLVLSTIHTNDAPSAVPRLLDLGVEPAVVAAGLAGVLAQRLVRKVCERCGTTVPSDYVLKNADILSYNSIDVNGLRMGEGCEVCNYTGYRGRTGLYSYLDISNAVQELIAARAPLSELIAVATDEGFTSLADSARELCSSGISTLDELRPFLLNPDVERTKETVAKEKQKKNPGFSSVSPKPLANKSMNGAVAENRADGSIFSKQRILLVEDDDGVREILAMLLKREMFEVDTAENGQEGLRKVYDTRPDIILCDLMMPVMDGKQFLIRMRSNESTKGIPIIFLTAVSTEDNEVELLSLGAREFISKSASSEVLLTRIRRVLQT